MGWLKSLFGGGRREGPPAERDPRNAQQEVYRPSGPPVLPEGARDPRVVEAVVAHIERHMGPAQVLLDPSSDTMPIDLVIVPPRDEDKAPLWTIATAGMSARAMNAPPRFHDDRFAELLIRLPPEWPMPDLQTGEPGGWSDPAARWPADYLRSLALYPHTYRTWFGLGQSVGSEDEAQTIADGVYFTAAMFLNPVTVPVDGFDRFPGAYGVVNLLNVLPLYPEEAEYKRLHGAGGLIDLAGRLLFHMGIIDPERPSALDPVEEGEA